jgi:conjugative transfer region protein TrbK
MKAGAVIRCVAYIVLAVAFLATAIALNNRVYPPADGLKAESSPTADTSDADLIRCRVLRREAANSAACKMFWQAARERFLAAKKAYAEQDRPTEPVPAVANPNEPTAAGEEQLSAPADGAGRPQ